MNILILKVICINVLQLLKINKHSYMYKICKNNIVKCDQVYQIPEKNIQFKIGQVDIDDYMRFMEAYNEFLSDLSNSLAEI